MKKYIVIVDYGLGNIRSAEQSFKKVVKENNIWLPYLNRLSDYLFVLARYISSEQGAEEILWDREI